MRITRPFCNIAFCSFLAMPFNLAIHYLSPSSYNFTPRHAR
nr:MAG TPA: hypothetical protein [Caudoviricetes sp.]